MIAPTKQRPLLRTTIKTVILLAHSSSDYIYIYMWHKHAGSCSPFSSEILRARTQTLWRQCRVQWSNSGIVGSKNAGKASVVGGEGRTGQTLASCLLKFKATSNRLERRNIREAAEAAAGTAAASSTTRLLLKMRFSAALALLKKPIVVA
jgi:hypothetical protein